MATSPYKIYSVRELLERISYMGPVQSKGGGINKTYTWSGAVTEQTVWQPQSGNRFIVSVLQISATSDGTVTIFDEVDGDEHVLFEHTFDESTGDRYCMIPYPVPRTSSAADNKLQITVSGGAGTLVVWGWESGEATTTTSTSTSSSSSSSSSISTSSSSSSSSSSISSSSSSISSSSSSISSSSSSSSISSSSSSVSTSSISTSSISSSSSSVSTSSVSTSSVSISTSSISQTSTG